MSTTSTAVSTAPDLSLYRDLHQAMRTATEQLVVGIETLPASDTARATALGTWFAGYSGELRVHHHVEDTIFFPALRGRGPIDELPWDRLLVEHHDLDRVIDELAASFRSLTTDPTDWTTTSERAFGLAVELRDLLAEHLDIEDDEVLPLIETRFTAEEYDALDHRAIKTVPFRQLRFTVPWMMATLHPDAAERLRAGARPTMRVLWKITRGRYERLVKRAFGQGRSVPPWA
ncbi:hemerythrin domain-containing protein, partial [Ilumatobacter sp.]|uniref:hemerythrin domain-containing protein n=1 Tax=Ilumatobacter sp. TaxID=1967498 RepID=UPI003C4273F5